MLGFRVLDLSAKVLEPAVARRLPRASGSLVDLSAARSPFEISKYVGHLRYQANDECDLASLRLRRCPSHLAPARTIGTRCRTDDSSSAPEIMFQRQNRPRLLDTRLAGRCPAHGWCGVYDPPERLAQRPMRTFWTSIGCRRPPLHSQSRLRRRRPYMSTFQDRTEPPTQQQQQ